MDPIQYVVLVLTLNWIGWEVRWLWDAVEKAVKLRDNKEHRP